MHCGERTVAGVPLLFCGTGYTGEDGVELLCDPLRAGELWDALLAAGVAPAGSGRATRCAGGLLSPLRQRSVEDRTPIAAGLGWACPRRPASSAPMRSPPSARRVPPSAGRLRDHRARDRPAGQSGRRRRDGHQRHLLALPGARSGLAYVPAERAEPGTELEIDVRGTLRARPSCPSRSTQRGPEPWPMRAIPTICSTTPSTTGRGSTATRRPSGSPGSRRTRSARSCSSIRPRSALRSARTSRTPRSSRSRRSRTCSRRCRARSSRSTTRSPASPRRSTTTPTATGGW